MANETANAMVAIVREAYARTLFMTKTSFVPGMMSDGFTDSCGSDRHQRHIPKAPNLASLWERIRSSFTLALMLESEAYSGGTPLVSVIGMAS